MGMPTPAVGTSRNDGTDEDRPTLLVVGKLGPIESALRTALLQRGMLVEVASKEEAVTTAFAAAPDLILLAGDAAQQEGTEVLDLLAKNPSTSVLPVVLLADDPTLERKLQAFRHGAVAVVPRSASVDDMARRITDLAGEVHERLEQGKGELGEASLDELVDLLSKEVRSGILSVKTGNQPGDTAQTRFVVRAGRPVQQAIEQFVMRLRPLIRETHAPLQYTFEESTVARLDLLDGATDSGPAAQNALEGRRILLVHDNPAQADVLAQELRARGATVVVSDGEGTALGRARELDPELVLVDAKGMDSWAYRVMTELRKDPRLRWASMLVVDWNEVWPAAAPAPNVDRLAAGIAPLIEPDRSLAERARTEATFDTRLEVLGPGRTLRALADTGETLHVTVRHPRATVEMDLAEGLVAGASWQQAGSAGAPEEGPAALAAMLALASGRVRVEKREVPSTANIMAPVPDALHAAAAEKPPLTPSMPPGQPGALGAAAVEMDDPLTVRAPTLAAAHSTDFDVDLDEAQTRVADIPVLAPLDAVGAAAPPPSPPPPPRPVSAGAAAPRAGGSDPAVPAELVSELRSLVQELRATRGSSSGDVAAPPEAVPSPRAAAAKAPPAPPRPAPPTAAPAQRAAAPAVQAEEPRRPAFSRGKLILGLSLVAGLGVGVALAVFLGELKLPGSGEGEAVATASPPQAGEGPAAAAPAEPAEPGPAPTEPVTPEEPAGAALDEAEADEEGVDEGEAAGADEGEAAGTADDDADEDDGNDDADEDDAAEDGPADKVAKRRAMVDSLILRANAQRRLRRFSQAEALYQKALRMHPRNPRALAGVTRVYMATGKKQAAVQHARRLVQSRPAVASNYVLLGDTLAAAGDTAGAKRAWRQALKLAPGYAPAKQRLQ
jgi:CheY-like chemotaxis protein